MVPPFGFNMSFLLIAGAQAGLMKTKTLALHLEAYIMAANSSLLQEMSQRNDFIAKNWRDFE